MREPTLCRVILYHFSQGIKSNGGTNLKVGEYGSKDLEGFLPVPSPAALVSKEWQPWGNSNLFLWGSCLGLFNGCLLNVCYKLPSQKRNWGNSYFTLIAGLDWNKFHNLWMCLPPPPNPPHHSHTHTYTHESFYSSSKINSKLKLWAEGGKLPCLDHLQPILVP